MDLATFRHEKDRFMKSHPQSPLTAQQKRDFSGLKYYPENPALRFEVAVTPDPEKPSVVMATSTGDEQHYVREGFFRFTVDGREQTLYVYRAEGGGDYFLPFVDQTSGNETYGAGRYLEVEPLPDGKLEIDFNLAYNPYCAYNENWSCPIPPRENRITARIEAGEKAFHS